MSISRDKGLLWSFAYEENYMTRLIPTYFIRRQSNDELTGSSFNYSGEW